MTSAYFAPKNYTLKNLAATYFLLWWPNLRDFFRKFWSKKSPLFWTPTVPYFPKAVSCAAAQTKSKPSVRFDAMHRESKRQPLKQHRPHPAEVANNTISSSSPFRRDALVLHKGDRNLSNWLHSALARNGLARATLSVFQRTILLRHPSRRCHLLRRSLKLPWYELKKRTDDSAEKDNRPR